MTAVINDAIYYSLLRIISLIELREDRAFIFVLKIILNLLN